MKGVLRVDLSDDEKCVVQRAEEVVRRAYAPLTGVRVGSALLTERGVYEGCNVESVISGLGICAERNAVNHALIHEGRDLKMLMLSVAWNRDDSIRPCGACLQYINEFSSDDVKIIMAGARSSDVMVGYLMEMLPYRYKPNFRKEV